jgi:hypothetical protein
MKVRQMPDLHHFDQFKKTNDGGLGICLTPLTIWIFKNNCSDRELSVCLILYVYFLKTSEGMVNFVLVVCSC